MPKIRLIITLIGLALIGLELYLLSIIFPFTGPGGFYFVLPILIIAILSFLYLLYRWTKNTILALYTFIWSLTTISILVLNLFVFPQETRNNPFQQIASIFDNVDNYENIKQSDLSLPETEPNYARRDCRIKDAEEKYLVASYKFQNQVKAKKYNPFFETNPNDERSQPKKKLVWWLLKLKNKRPV